jgi:hypothetical protein
MTKLGWCIVTGMEKAQSLTPHSTMHMPSKATVVTCIVVLHVVALTYLLYALYTAQRHAALLLGHALTLFFADAGLDISCQ